MLRPGRTLSSLLIILPSEKSPINQLWLFRVHQRSLSEQASTHTFYQNPLMNFTERLSVEAPEAIRLWFKIAPTRNRDEKREKLMHNCRKASELAVIQTRSRCTAVATVRPDRIHKQSRRLVCVHEPRQRFASRSLWAHFILAGRQPWQHHLQYFFGP